MMDAVMRQESQVLFQRPLGSRFYAIKPKGPRTRASCSSASFPALAPPMLSRAQNEPTGIGAVHTAYDALHSGPAGLRIEQASHSGNLGSLVQVRLTPVRRNQFLLMFSKKYPYSLGASPPELTLSHQHSLALDRPLGSQEPVTSSAN